MADQVSVERGNKRDWPICVQRKRFHGTHKAFTRSIPRKTFCIQDRYKFPEFQDPVQRALAWHMLSGEKEKSNISAQRLQDLASLSDQYRGINAYRAEQRLAEYMDDPVAILLNALRASAVTPARQKLGMLRRFIGLTILRSPSWFEHFDKPTTRAALDSTRTATASALRDLPAAEGFHLVASMEHVLERALYPMSLERYALGTPDPLRDIHPKFTLVTATGRVGFVIGDNAARPWRMDGMGGIDTSHWPGLLNRSTQITFPISPRECLVLRYHPAAPLFSRNTVDETVVRQFNTAQITFAVDEVVYPSLDRGVFVRDLNPDDVPPWTEPRPAPDNPGMR